MSKVDIRYLDKATLIFHLWQNAKKSPYLRHYHRHISVDIATIKNDLMLMQADGAPCSFTIYYGKVLLVDVTNDSMDVRDYDFYNGKNKAVDTIAHIKMYELWNLMAFIAKYS